MKKIKTLMLTAFAVVAAAVALSSCSNDDETKVEERFVSEFSTIDNEVAAQKKASGNNKAILLVAFGSTWNNAFLAFDKTVSEYKKAFAGYDVYLSFSSDICINRAHAGENVDESGQIVKRDYYSPNYWLHALGAAKYQEIRVQSLQVIPGEEFAAVVACVKKFANNGYIFDARLDDEYLKTANVYLGMPLLADAEEDVPAVAMQLNDVCKAQVTQGIVAFMGHGNPDSYDTFKANIRYNQLEEALQTYSPNYFVGCVDQPENFKPFVLARMHAAGLKDGKLFLHPLMSIAGDHAHNDMAGDDGDDVDPNDWELNEEGEVEDVSWKVFFNKMGYDCTDETCALQGLLELDGIRNIWIQHTKQAELLEDAYHSMYPEAE